LLHCLKREHRPAGIIAVSLVHDQYVGDLKQARFERLNLVTHAGRLDHDGRVRRTRDLHLGLACAHRLDQHAIEAGSIQELDNIRGGAGETTKTPSRGHATDEDAGVS
jgi:hypothetical protein